MLEKLRDECTFLEHLEKKAQKDIASAPPGKLRIKSCKKTTEYYYRKEKSDKLGTYINAQNKSLAQQLAQKSYAEDVLKILDKRVNDVKSLISKYEKASIENLIYKYDDARKALIKPYVLTDDEYVKAWLEKPYTPNPKHAENLIFETRNGEMVRSKSEVIIADNLKRLGIPYKYEAPFECKDGSILYPDFTLLNIRTRKLVYHEHFGKMDDPEYRDKQFFWKIKKYNSEGIYQGRNLIMSFEEYNKPFDFRTYEKMFNELLL